MAAAPDHRAPVGSDPVASPRPGSTLRPRVAPVPARSPARRPAAPAFAGTPPAHLPAARSRTAPASTVLAAAPAADGQPPTPPARRRGEHAVPTPGRRRCAPPRPPSGPQPGGPPRLGRTVRRQDRRVPAPATARTPRRRARTPTPDRPRRRDSYPLGTAARTRADPAHRTPPAPGSRACGSRSGGYLRRPAPAAAERSTRAPRARRCPAVPPATADPRPSPLLRRRSRSAAGLRAPIAPGRHRVVTHAPRASPRAGPTPGTPSTPLVTVAPCW